MYSQQQHQQSGVAWHNQNQTPPGHGYQQQPRAPYPQYQQSQQVQAFPNPIPQQFAVMGVRVGYPPFNLQLDVAPGIVQHIPLLISLGIAEIEAKVGTNNLRTHMFNLYIQNGYQNERFTTFIDLAANYMELILIGGGANGNEQNAAHQAIDQLAELVSGSLVEEEPGLWQVLPPQITNILPRKLQQLGQIINDCIALKNNRQQYFQRQNNQGGAYGQPGQYQQQPQYQGGQARGWGNNNAPHSHQQGGYQQRGGLQSDNGGFYRRNNPLPVAAAPVSDVAIAPRANRELERLRRKTAEREQTQQAQWQGQQIQQAAQQQVVQTSAWERPAPVHKPVVQSTHNANLRQPFVARQPQPAPAPPPANYVNGYNADAIIEEFGSEIDHYSPIDRALIAEEEAAQADTRQAPNFSGNWGEPVQVQDGDKIYGEYPIEFDQPFVTQVQQASTLYTSENLPKGVTWKSTKKQPYHPAWNPFLFKCYYVFDQDGDLLATILPKTEREMNMMEYDRHVIGRIPTRASRFPKTDKTGQVVDSEIKHYADAPADVNVSSSEKITMEVHESVGAINAHIEAITNGELKDDNSAVRKNILVAEPLPCENAAQASYYRATIKEIADSGNFDDAARILKTLDAPEDLLLFNRIDALLTEEVNRALSVNMMMPNKLKIGSFTEDAPALHDYLTNKYGTDVAKALSDQQARLIARTIGTLDEADSLEFQTNWLDEEDEPVFDENTSQEEKDAETERKAGKPTLAFLSSTVTYTLLSTYMFELALAKSDQAAHMLTQNYNPNLYQIAVDLFNDEFVKRSNIRRHYFLTKDGVKFEITRGFLNKAAYIIALA